MSYDIELYRLLGAGDLLAQIHERRQRGEEPTPSAEKDQDRLIGKPTEKKRPWKVIGLVIFLIAAIGVVVVRQQRMSELPPNVKKELRDLQERAKNPATWGRESRPQPDRR